jgi:hypothetical protein
MVMAVREEHS